MAALQITDIENIMSIEIFLPHDVFNMFLDIFLCNEELFLKVDRQGGFIKREYNLKPYIHLATYWMEKNTLSNKETHHDILNIGIEGKIFHTVVYKGQSKFVINHLLDNGFVRKDSSIYSKRINNIDQIKFFNILKDKTGHKVISA